MCRTSWSLFCLCLVSEPDGSTWTPPAPPPNLSVQQPPSGNKNDEDRGRPRKKRSRWGIAKTEIPGMPASISNDLTPQQQKAYIGKCSYIIITFFSSMLSSVILMSQKGKFVYLFGVMN